MRGLFSVRAVTYEDLPQIGSLAISLKLEDFSEQGWDPKAATEAIAAHEGLALIALQKKRPAGFIIASAEAGSQRSSAKILWCCFDDPDAGEMLVRGLRDRLSAEHINELTITLPASNENGIDFYKKAGLTKIKETRIVCANETIFDE